MKNQDKFIRFVRRKCKQLGVQFTIGKGRTVLFMGEGSDGFFTPPDKWGPGELKVARKCENFILTVAHEYVHMLQWFFEDPIYTDGDYYKLEKKTEKDAQKLLKDWNIPARDRERAARMSKKYLHWLKEKRDADL